MQQKILNNIIKTLLLALFFVALPSASFAALGVSTIGVCPPGTNNASCPPLTDTTATLIGGVEPDGPTSIYFRYSILQIAPIFCNEIYGSNMISTKEEIVSGSATVYKTIENLKPDTTYYFCAIASNKKEITYGSQVNSSGLPDNVRTFRTLPCQTCDQTTVVTKPAGSINSSTATVKGSFSSTKAVTTYFQYKKKALGAWQSTPDVNHPAYSNGNIQHKLLGLDRETEYQFRAVAETSSPAEVFYGQVLEFKTYKFNTVSTAVFNTGTPVVPNGPGPGPGPGGPGPGPVIPGVPVQCTDGVQQPNETNGVDSGGPCGPSIPDHCSNGVQDSGETGVDIGGPCTDENNNEIPDQCENGVQDPNETGVDIGGPCGDNGPDIPDLPDHCENGTQDFNETGVDIGGSCGNNGPDIPDGEEEDEGNGGDDSPGGDTDGGDGDPGSEDPDTDDDGIPDVYDDDIDGDGIPNDEDDDIDGDGIDNGDDTTPDGDGTLDDIDGDGIPNEDDWDVDGDGVANVYDDDIDGDGIENNQDWDSDGDGIPDTIDSNPYGVGTLDDIDGGGIPNEYDSDIDGDGIPNIIDDDTDGDGIPNESDNDMDGDGVPNNEDSSSTGIGTVNDYDGDGISNNEDLDMDGDGVLNINDLDVDGDGIPNNSDPDADNDGIPNNNDSTPYGAGSNPNTVVIPLVIGAVVMPPYDDIVRYHEGIEHVFIRRIMKSTVLQKKYGYVPGTNLRIFAQNLAHSLAKGFGYVDASGREIRVSKPDVSAYSIRVSGNKIAVYEYYLNKIIDIRTLTSNFKNKNPYEYYFTKVR